MPDTVCVTGKIPYGSRHATAESRGNVRNKGQRMRPYFCDLCHRWHLTREVPKEDRA